MKHIIMISNRKQPEVHEAYHHDYSGGIKLTFNKFQPVEHETEYRSHIASYVMKRHPHGIAVIISNKSFTSSKLSPLQAADNDVHNLRETFRFLDYKVEINRNCTAKQIRQTFESIVTV